MCKFRVIKSTLLILLLTPILSTTNLQALPANNCNLKLALNYIENNYSLEVINNGDDTCKVTTLSIYYKQGETFVSSVPAPRAKGYYWNIGDLAPNQKYNLSIVTKSNQDITSERQTSACASADNGADACSETTNSPSAPTPPVVVLPQVPPPIVTLPQPDVTQSVSTTTKEYGIWDWETPSTMTTTYATSVIEVAKKNGFNVIYLTIDDYLPIAQIKNVARRNSEKNKYMQNLSGFIASAKRAGISVDAEGGDKDWALSQNTWKGYALIDFVKEFNSKYPNSQIRNFQYDVEPYLLSNYESEKAKVLTQYIGFIDESAKRLQTSNIGFSMTIPHFYDATQAWTPEITYNGVKASTFTQLLNVLKQKENTSVLIMAYRNYFDGTGGTKEISEPEVKEASSGKYKTKIIVAQETGNVDPSYVTFYGLPKSSLLGDLTKMDNSYRGYSNYGGKAVHYIDPFALMK